MGKKNADNEFFASVVAANEGISKKDVERVFIWYDLLAYALPFQIIFALIYTFGPRQYAYTMISALSIIIVDAIIKNSLEKDGKNFVKFQKNITLVKLWVIPLIVMGCATTVATLVIEFGLI